MLLAWMGYSVLFGTLVCAAALAAERVAATWGRAQRFVWLGALVAAIAVPPILATRPRILVSAVPPTTVGAPLVGDVTIEVAGAVGRPPTRETLAGRVSRLVAASDDVMIGAWAIASIVGLVLLARAAIGLRRRRVLWRAVELDGVPVLVAPNVGPAVVGALVPCVVLPQWSLALDASARALMLRHEVEHIRARDPLLLFGAVATAALAPWNAALWYIVRRLHLAVEIDCDQRVLRASAQPREYGELLLAVGARLNTPLPFATSLAERRPSLERRIRAMTGIRPRHPRVVTAACVALVAIATTAATRSPRPMSFMTRSVATRPATASSARATTPASPIATDNRPAALDVPKVTKLETMPAEPAASPQGPDSLTIEQIRALIAAHHPTALAGDPDINTITLVVNARGEYVVSMAESRPFESEGRGGRGRSGGLGVAFGTGGGIRGGARGGVSGEVPTVDDSVRVARIAAEIEALIAKLAEAGGDPAQSVLVRRLRTTKIVGDTVVTVNEAKAGLDSVLVLRSRDSARRVVEARAVADLIGVNMPALAQLIDPQTIDAVTVDVFRAGELGITPLRVFVVRQKP